LSRHTDNTYIICFTVYEHDKELVVDRGLFRLARVSASLNRHINEMDAWPSK